MVTYGTRLDEFDLGHYGSCKFLNWLHPQEGKKEFDEKQIDWLAQFISPGESCVDIGGYTGDTALPMAIAAGANGEVVVYEPNPTTYDILYQNAKLNPQFAPIKCRNAAVGVRKEYALFKYDETRMNGGALVPGEEVKVRVERLDAFKFKGPIAFLKIDTEGQDAAILTEFSNRLRHDKTIVQVERYPHLDEAGAHNLWMAIQHYGIPFMEGDWQRNHVAELPKGLCNIMITPYA